MSIVASAVLVGLQRNLFYLTISHRSSVVPWVPRNRRNIVPVLPVGKRHKARWTAIHRFEPLDFYHQPIRFENLPENGLQHFAQFSVRIPFSRLFSITNGISSRRSIFQYRILPSRDPEMTLFPFFDPSTDVTQSWCPLSGILSRLRVRFFIIALIFCRMLKGIIRY